MGAGASTECKWQREMVHNMGFQLYQIHIEKKEVENNYRQEKIMCFNAFILDVELPDLPLVGRKFTWYRADGKTMRRLNRFLLSEDWLCTWCNSRNEVYNVVSHITVRLFLRRRM